MQLSEKYSYLFKLPSLLSSYLARQDIDSIIEIYSKHITTIKAHINLPVFKTFSRQLEETIEKVRELLLNNVTKDRVLTYDKISKTIS